MLGRETGPEPPPRTDSVKLMAWVDKRTPAMRALIHEFGLVVVADMYTDGHTRAAELRPILESWRSRRQEEWLATNYIANRTGRSMRRIYERALGNGEGN